MYMPFGRHRGLPLREIPASYLIWLLAECDLKPPLRRAVEAELSGRRRQSEAAEHDEPERPAGNVVSRQAVADVLRRWRREMAMRWHPDRGGSHEAMIAVTAAADRLHELLEV